jgi:hypothetical protein
VLAADWTGPRRPRCAVLAAGRRGRGVPWPPARRRAAGAPTWTGPPVVEAPRGGQVRRAGRGPPWSRWPPDHQRGAIATNAESNLLPRRVAGKSVTVASTLRTSRRRARLSPSHTAPASGASRNSASGSGAVVALSGWGRVAVVVMACVVAAGRLDQGRAAWVRVAAGLACLDSGRTARRAGQRCWRVALGGVAVLVPGGRRRTAVRRCVVRRRPGRRAAGIRGVRRRLRRARPAW